MPTIFFSGQARNLGNLVAETQVEITLFSDGFPIRISRGPSLSALPGETLFLKLGAEVFDSDPPGAVHAEASLLNTRSGLFLGPIISPILLIIEPLLVEEPAIIGEPGDPGFFEQPFFEPEPAPIFIEPILEPAPDPVIIGEPGDPGFFEQF